jgi:hypothetical protein
MRAFTAVCVLLLGTAPAALAQQTPQDSAARAKADSIALARQLEALMKQPPDQEPKPVQQGPANPRLLPDFSAVGDFVFDGSPDRSTQESGKRADIREVELAVQAAVDPFFRADVFLGISDEEGIAIEQAYLTTTSLPYGLEARLGRFLMPAGKVNTTHRHDVHTVEYPWVVQRFFGAEGLKGTGLGVSKIFAPFGFFQEILLTAVDHFGEDPEDVSTFEPANNTVGGLGYSARLRNYWDLSQSANVELSGSVVTGKRARPFGDVEIICQTSDNCATGGNARQTVVGGDVTFRWRPLEQGLYKSFILQAEVMHQLNDGFAGLPSGLGSVELAGGDRAYTGGYVFGRYQITARGFLGARFDWLQDPEAIPQGGTFRAVSGYWEFFPSDFSKFNIAFERLMPHGDAENTNRVLAQATFALGPHKPHPF